MKRKVIYLILLCGLALGLSLLTRNHGHHQLQGYIEAENLYLASPFSGTLKERPVSRGTVVQKGDLVFMLSPNPEAIRVKEIESLIDQEYSILEDLKKPKRVEEQEIHLAKYDQVKARLILAKLRMKRFKELYLKKAGTLDQADSAVQHFNEMKALFREQAEQVKLSKMGARKDIIVSQQNRMSATKAKLALLKWQLQKKTLHAPDSGVIYDTYYSVGEWVPAGKPVASLLSPKNVLVEFFVSLELLAKLKVGQVIEVTSPGQEGVQKATIQYISPEAEYVPPLVYSRDNYDKIVYRVKAKPKKPGLFKPGQPVTVGGF